MGIFRRRQKQPALPNDIIPMMERFGRFEFDPQGSGEDAGDIWGQWAERVIPFAEADPNGFLIALAEAVLPVGGWAVYGASRTIWECFSSKEVIRQHPSYKAIMSAALEFLRTSGVRLGDLRPYEREYWLASGGTIDTW